MIRSFASICAGLAAAIGLAAAAPSASVTTAGEVMV
jgi:hypothetical protein